MRSRANLSGLLGCLILLLPAAAARADDTTYRVGLGPSIGGGVAGVIHPGPLPGFIGFTDLGVEILGEIRPFGLFLRGDFLSSGNDGRWTAYSATVGGSYRLFGDSRHFAAFLRGGIVYEHWIGTASGPGSCNVLFLVPNSCNLLGAAVPLFSTDGDSLGVLAGARLELPVPVVYVALDASIVPTIDVDSSYPGGAVELRFDLVAALRDDRAKKGAMRYTPPDELRRKWQ